MFNRKLKKELYDQNQLVLSMKDDMQMMYTSIDSVNFLLKGSTEPKEYKTRESQISNIITKYQGLSTNSNYVLQRLVNLRVAFSIPNRLFLIKNTTKEFTDEEIKDAKDFLNSFMAHNKLNSALPRDLAKEAELQGQVAVGLDWDAKALLPSISYFPYNKTGYKVKSKDRFRVNSKLVLDMSVVKNSVVTDIPIAFRGQVVQDDNFVFIAFNDLLGEHEGVPTCGPILRVIDNIESDLEDWRTLNHLFAHPTPHFKTESKEEALSIHNMIAANGWKVGTAIATNGEFKLVGPTGSEANMLMLSITTNAKVVSGHTGIGIHFLGFANVMSNRATADSMGEPTEVVLHSEIASWRSFYTDLFIKAIRLRNKKLNRKIREDIVLPWLVPLTDRQWSVIKDVLIPARDKGDLSQETLLNNIPGIDADEEMALIAAEEEIRDEKRKRIAIENKENGIEKVPEEPIIEEKEEDEITD